MVSTRDDQSQTVTSESTGSGPETGKFRLLDPESGLCAYRIPGSPRMRIEPASPRRPWMDAIDHRWPTRCLPMVVANQFGWTILNSQAFFAKWTGGKEPASIQLVYPKGVPPFSAESHFGYGILTWVMPYLFRTMPGYNLLVRGPANSPKDGICPLEGLVETDWAVQTFTMNWKFTRPGVVVPFSVGEPICMIVPQRRRELEAFEPVIRDLASAPATAAAFDAFASKRGDALTHHPWNELTSETGSPFWQKTYFRGQFPDGQSAPEHQTSRALREFDDQTS